VGRVADIIVCDYSEGRKGGSSSSSSSSDKKQPQFSSAGLAEAGVYQKLLPEGSEV
jgi:hypothetical protein